MYYKVFFLFVFLPIYPFVYYSSLFGAQFLFPVLVFSPSVLPSSPLVSTVGRSRLKLSKRQVEQVQHSTPPPCSVSLSLSLEHSLPRTPLRGSRSETERKENRDTVGGNWGKREMLTFSVLRSDTVHLKKHPPSTAQMRRSVLLQLLVLICYSSWSKWKQKKKKIQDLRSKTLKKLIELFNKLM